MQKENNNLIMLGVAGLMILVIGGFIIVNRQNNNIDSPQDANQQMEQPADEAQDTNQEAQTQEDSEETNMTEPTQNIVEIAASNESFKTLVQAVTAAGLVDTLNSEGPFTVFAPTDEAFAKLPEGTVESLLNNKEDLTKILTYHVIPGKVMASDVVKLTSATTVQGQDVIIKVDGDTVMVNDAKVVSTDIVGTNGVIHVIDTVLLPK